MDMSKVSVPQAAERLGVSPARVRQRIDDGSLVAEKIGGRWLVDLEASQPAPSQRGRPVSASSVWWSLASAEVATAVLPRLVASVVASDLQRALKPAVDVSALRKALLPAFDSDALRKAVMPAVDVSVLQAAMKPAINSTVSQQSLLPRMRIADLVLADLFEADGAPKGHDASGASADMGSVNERADQYDIVGPRFVAEVKKLSRSTRNRAMHRFANAVQERDHGVLLAWLSNRASRALYVAAAPDLAAMRDDSRLVASGVSHPDSHVDDPRIVEAYVGVDDVDGVVSDYWLEKPTLDERPNVVFHVAPVRPRHVGAMLLAADLAEHGGPREVNRAHELLTGAMDALISGNVDMAQPEAADQAPA